MNLKKKNIFIVLLMTVLFSAYESVAHAYVDPGTAGYLYQIIFIAFSGLLAFFAIFKNAVRAMLGNLFKKNSSKKD